MKVSLRHVLCGTSYFFDLSGEKSRRLRVGLVEKYWSRGLMSDADMLNRDAKKLNGDMRIAFTALEKRYG